MTGPLFFGFWRRALTLAALATLAACASHVSAPPAPPPMSYSDQQCLAELNRLGVQYQVEPQSASTSKACLVQNPIRVSAATIPFNRPAVAACGFVLKFDEFERQVIRPMAKRTFGHDLKEIVHFGAYNCRPTHAGRESEHAHGLAMDIAGFVLTDGTMISVKQEWTKRGKARDFLHAVATQACGYFSEVLDPDSDRDHVDHIHLDLGRWKYCIHHK
ncbi:MAG TPA: extensin family protein [Stellaceae bacterium]|nr:extensin family protein [Stellaceae bacterium]